MTKFRAILLFLIFGVAAFLFVQLFPGRRIPRHFNGPSIVSSQPLRSQAISIRFSPDSKYLLVAGSVGKGSLGRYQNGEYLFSFKNYDKRLRLFDVSKGQEIERLKAEPIFGGWNGNHMFLMPDFQTMVTAGHFTEIKTVDIRKRRPDKVIAVEGALTSVDVSPDSKTLALGTMSGVQFHNAKTFGLLKYYKHYGGNFGAEIRFSRNSRTVRSKWKRSKNPHYIDAKTGKRIPTPRSTREFEVTFSPDGKYFADMTKGNIKIWQHDAKGSFKIGAVKSTLVSVNTVQFSPDGKTLAIAGESSTENPVRFYKMSDIRASNKPL